MKTSTIRQKVMHYAHSLYGTLEMTWRDCLRRAWKIIRLVIRLHEGSVYFTYLKTDGTLRKAFGTLRVGDIAPSSGSRMKKPNHSVICYFDLDKWQYRSFRIRNLVF